jgi:hypothetical protein
MIPVNFVHNSILLSLYKSILGFPFKIEHSHLPQLLHFTDEVPVRFMNTFVNPTSSVASVSSSSSLSTTTPSGSMTTLTTSMMSNGSAAHGILQPLSLIPPETPPTLLPNLTPMFCNNKSLDAKKYLLKQILSLKC